MNWQQLKKIIAFYTRFTLSFTQIGFVLRRLFWADFTGNFAAQRWVITGGSDGLGLHIAREAARRGAEVTIVARDDKRLAQAIAESQSIGPGRIKAAICDFSLQGDTARLVRELVASNTKIDVLINNVGVLNDDHSVTIEGRESSFVINFLSHYLLTEGLIRRQAFASKRPLVINMTSGGGYNVPLSTALLNMTNPQTFNGTAAYGFHKRGMVVLTKFWRDKYAAQGFDFYVMHPGWVDTAGVKRSLPRFRKILRPILRNTAAGGDTAIWLAATRPQQPDTELVWFDRKARPAHVYARTRVSADTSQTLVLYLDQELAKFPDSMP